MSFIPSKKTLIIAGVAIMVVAAVGFLFYKKPWAKPGITFAMIKPDAVAAKNSGKIIDAIETNGFNIVRMEKVRLSKEKAEAFYAVHKDKPFFNELVTFMTSGPVVVMALQKENAIQAWRDLMGATNPAFAPEGSLRKLFGTSIETNAVHGSDAPETAQQELAFFFPDLK